MTASVDAAAQLEPAAAPDRSRSGAQMRYIGGRVLGALSSLLFVLVLNFILFRVLPNDPARTLARGRVNTPEKLEAINKRFGLDDSLPVQFLTYLKNMAVLDFGDSFKYSQSVRGLILDRLAPTIVLVGAAIILATVIGLWIGTVAAWNRGRPIDSVSTTSTIVLYAMPEWWLGLLLFMGLAVGVGPLPDLFPIGGLLTPGLERWSFEGIVDQAWHLVLPVLTLTLGYLAEYALIMRSSLLDEMGEDYLLTARAKGLRDVMVRRRHAMPNALLPVVTLVSLNLGFVVSGAITIEYVFSIPGLGGLSAEAVQIPDFPVLQGTFMIFSAAVIVANLVSNLLYSWLDPRVHS